MVDLKKKADSPAATFIRYERLHTFKMNQDEFAASFGVQVGTLRNWEQGISEPPAYFIKYVEERKANMHNGYQTKIEELKLADKKELETSTYRQLSSDMAKTNIEEDKTQSEIYDVIQKMISEDGIIENLQRISPAMFNDYTTTDISAIGQMILLSKINDKLDKIVGILSQIKL